MNVNIIIFNLIFEVWFSETTTRNSNFVTCENLILQECKNTLCLDAILTASAANISQYNPGREESLKGKCLWALDDGGGGGQSIFKYRRGVWGRETWGDVIMTPRGVGRVGKGTTRPVPKLTLGIKRPWVRFCSAVRKELWLLKSRPL